jgi:hypothetical protein
VKVGELRKVLEVAGGHYREDGLKAEADALSMFAANLLEGEGESTVAAFVKRVEKARKPRPAVRPRTRARAG